jgi:probable HAF family extracellular repeat protein
LKIGELLKADSLVDPAFCWKHGLITTVRKEGNEMKKNCLMMILVFLVFCTVCFASSLAFAVREYTITDLDTFCGNDISESGYVVGLWPIRGDAYNHAYLYRHGVMTDLGTLGGLTSVGYAVNNRGQVVGYSRLTQFPNHAFLYSDGVMTDLGTLGYESEAMGINDAGLIVGQSRTSNDRYTHAFLYQDGVMHDLGTLGGDNSVAHKVNAAGEIVGISQNEHYINRAFLYSHGVMQDLGTLGGDSSWALDINNKGDVVGASYTSTGDWHAYLYSRGVMIDLGDLFGKGSTEHGSTARAINDKGEVVGEAWFPGPGSTHAFLYSKGVMTDLNTLIPPDSGWVLNNALGINNAGQIVGYGIIDGEQHGFLLTLLVAFKKIPKLAMVIR